MGQQQRSKQFLCVLKSFQSHLQSLVSSEGQKERSQSRVEETPTTSVPITASLFLKHVNHIVGGQESERSETSSSSQFSDTDLIDECSICLDRRTEVILPCTHSFCTPCIEQWNAHNKTCPICCEALHSTDDTWILSEIPGVE